MSTHDITVLCPRCDHEIVLEVDVHGGERATRWQPAEDPEYAYAEIESCTHIPDDDEEFESGPFTNQEAAELEQLIINATNAAVEASAFDPAWDGPDT